MTKKYRLYQVDSFTDERFSGNPAGVVANADGLTDADMQKIARELNNSETAFIFCSDSDDYDVDIRFFTPVKEVPICGHATIAAHYIRAIENNSETIRLLHKTGAGILPVDVIKEHDSYRIVMTQGKIEFGDSLSQENKEILLSALGLKEAELVPECPAQIVSTGHSKVMIGIKTQTVLHRLKPNYDVLSKLSEAIGCNGYYVFTLDSEEEDILVHGRMFAPAIGINEDPVTGNANGPLGAYLVHYNLVKYEGAHFSFNARQGEAIGRAGTIGVEVLIEDHEPLEVKITGKAVIVFKTELVL